LVDPPAAGAWNMAVDEMLLARAAEQGEAVLRLYRWSPATLSLGYFQHAAERETHAASRTCPLVRRSSGGGAILHDHEVTYSLSLPTSHPAAADPETLYRRTHGLLVETLAEFGIMATLNERTLVPLGGEPFLCFQRRSVGDVLVDGHKICGSAQRRRKGALLQHGSILVAASSYAPELPGLQELSSQSLDIEKLQAAWLAGWRRWSHERGLPPPIPHDGLSSDAIQEVERIRDAQYGSAAWTNRK
jgi:lipoyl(octanoyl) transferase